MGRGAALKPSRVNDPWELTHIFFLDDVALVADAFEKLSMLVSYYGKETFQKHIHKEGTEKSN